MTKRAVQEQFGLNASAYATSDIHAKGRSLDRLVELTKPRPSWSVLDVATGPGHTAHIFSPHVKQVVAVDITPEMLMLVKKFGATRHSTNVVPVLCDAVLLPFSNNKFDLVTCRIAAHHFPSAHHFIAESARVLRPGGLLAIVDNFVPGSLGQGKLAQQERQVGRYINAFDRLRDPSHVHALSIDEWQRHYFENGFQIIHQEVERKTIDFNEWVLRMQVSFKNVVRLRVMLLQAPQAISEFLNPIIKDNHLQFELSEVIFVAKLSGDDAV